MQKEESFESFRDSFKRARNAKDIIHTAMIYSEFEKKITNGIENYSDLDLIKKFFIKNNEDLRIIGQRFLKFRKCFEKDLDFLNHDELLRKFFVEDNVDLIKTSKIFNLFRKKLIANVSKDDNKDIFKKFLIEDNKDLRTTIEVFKEIKPYIRRNIERKTQEEIQDELFIENRNDLYFTKEIYGLGLYKQFKSEETRLKTVTKIISKSWAKENESFSKLPIEIVTKILLFSTKIEDGKAKKIVEQNFAEKKAENKSWCTLY